jgi:SNF2 family DNA or RNA helicase
VVSTHNKVRYYTLMMADSIEERRWKLLMKKKSYHDKVFKGEVADQSDSARMTREDLLYILG